MMILQLSGVVITHACEKTVDYNHFDPTIVAPVRMRVRALRMTRVGPFACGNVFAKEIADALPHIVRAVYRPRVEKRSYLNSKETNLLGISETYDMITWL